MKKTATVVGVVLGIVVTTTALWAQQPADGENSFYLSAVNKRFLPVPDTISCASGRGVYVAAEPDLDNDGKPEILVTEYRDGGRILVFEVAGDNKLEYVWGSKRLNPGGFGGGSSPRTASVGDFDNNGKLEIHFHIGNAIADTLRGHYIYEWTGNDNDYGDEPVRVIKFEDVDPLFANSNIGLLENPLTIKDVDGDGKAEMLFTPRSFANLETGNLYILEVESGTFANGDANIRLEYKYTDMAKAIELGNDGYVPVGTTVGDIDSDGLNEIVVLGWTNINAGGGVGFLEVTGVNTYTPGSIVPLSDASIYAVKGGVAVVDVNGQKAVIIAGMATGNFDRKIWVADNIVSDALISASDFNVISNNQLAWGIIAIGDQDHGTGSDGFDIYYSNGSEIRDLEYKGTGALSDPASYTHHGRLGQFNLDQAYDRSDGLFNSIFTYPGMDIDNDGNRDIVVGHKGACGDAGDMLEGQLFTLNTYGIFVFEWGDSTQSIPITLTTGVKGRQPGWTLITPDDYHLEQNYPNPFNPSTTITFSLPLNKRISLSIYNMNGQEIKKLIADQDYSQGTHSVQWDATDDQGNPVASGVYIYRLVYGNFSKTKTMTLVR